MSDDRADKAKSDSDRWKSQARLLEQILNRTRDQRNAARRDLHKLKSANQVPLGTTVREACRMRHTINGADAQALETALSSLEAERDLLIVERDMARGGSNLTRCSGCSTFMWWYRSVKEDEKVLCTLCLLRENDEDRDDAVERAAQLKLKLHEAQVEIDRLRSILLGVCQDGCFCVDNPHCACCHTIESEGLLEN